MLILKFVPHAGSYSEYAHNLTAELLICPLHRGVIPANESKAFKSSWVCPYTGSYSTSKACALRN